MKKLLVVGGSIKQIPMIQRAKELGYYVICIDGNPNSVGFEYADEYKTIDIRDFNRCVKYAKEKKIDGVSTISATATLPTVAYIGKELNLKSISYEISEMLKSKYKMKKKMIEYGLNSKGECFELHSLEEYEKIKGDIQLPIVVKPSDGSASKGVSIVKNEKEIDEAIKNAFKNSRCSAIYVEGYIEGKEYSVESFVYDGKIYVLGIINHMIKRENGRITEEGHSVPSGLSTDIEEIIKNEVKKAITALKINYGSVNMDIILENENRPYIIDVGPRIGLNLIASHMIPYSTNVNIIDNTISSSLGEHVSFEFEENKPIATRLLILKSGKIRNIGDFSKLIDGKKVLNIVLTVKEGDSIKPYNVKSDTCGWVIATGNNLEEANNNAITAKKQIEKYFKIE